MKLETAHLDQARKVADAVLYEGYLLYPYHQSSQKNQARFQFGVLMPPGYKTVDPSEPSASQTECLLECADDAQVLVGVRFLQLQRRRVLQVQPGSGGTREVASLTRSKGSEARTTDQNRTGGLSTFLSSPSAPFALSLPARASRAGGTSMPSALAVLRLMTNSKRDDCTTGKSAGFSPLRTRPA